MTAINDKKAKLTGILLQIPIWALCVFGIFKFILTIILGFTNYNMLEFPDFIGLRNYIWVFKNYGDAILNTLLYVFILAILAIFTAIIPAILISKLGKIWRTLALLAYSLTTLVYTAGSAATRFLYSYDGYGWLNALLMDLEIIDSPINPLPFMRLPILYFMLCGVIFFITYYAARRKKCCTGAAVSLCVLPVLMSFFDDLNICAIEGSGAGKWLPNVAAEFFGLRYEIGVASAIETIEFLLLGFWCAAVIGVMIGIHKLSQTAKESRASEEERKSTASQVFGIGFSILFLLILAFRLFVLISLSLKPLDELFAYPPSLWVLNPTLDSFKDATLLLNDEFYFYGDSPFSFSHSISTILVSLVAVIPAAFGISMLKDSGFKAKISLPLIALAFLSPAILIRLRSEAWMRVEFFASGIGCVALFLIAYTCFKFLFENGIRADRVAFAALTVLTATLGFNITASNFYFYRISWIKANELMVSGGIARTGAAAASCVMLILYTAVTVALPIMFLTMLRSTADFDKPELKD